MKTISLYDGRVTLVSDIDYEWLIEHTWRVTEHNASRRPYVCRTGIVDGKKTTIYMHRAIVKCPPVYKVDHRDGDGLNNQRGNLRIASYYQNNSNRSAWSLSGYKGVDQRGRRFRARITLSGEEFVLGNFETPEDAGRAYDRAAYDAHGEFAYLNFPHEWPHTIDPAAQEIPF